MQLNRPKQMNALNIGMVSFLNQYLKYLKNRDDNIKAMVLMGTGEKAFCAGGDVRYLLNVDKASQHCFFKNEFEMDYETAQTKFPLISVWDGVVMGGGVGISINGAFRICTESTTLAMPENAIGLFPDIGISHHFSRLKYPSLGMYIGLSGTRLNAKDVLQLRLASHFIPKSKLQEFINSIKEVKLTKDNAMEEINKLIDNFSTSPDMAPTITGGLMQEIDDYFKDFPTMKVLMKRLDSYTGQNPFPSQLAKHLRTLCPLSCAVWMKSFKQACTMNKSLKECLNTDYNLALNFMYENTNFRNGVTAVLIEKNNQPDWVPNTIEELNEDELDGMFQPGKHHLFEE